MVYWEEFNKISGSDAQKRAQMDFDDLQNEFAGRDVGRIKRFLTGTQHDPQAIQKRRADQETSLFLAQVQSEKMARLTEEWGEKLREARKFLDEARQKLAGFQNHINAERMEIDARAMRLPDGTRVYRGDDDRAYTRDGKLSDHPDAQNIIWQHSSARLSESQRNDERRQKSDALENKLDSADAEHGEMAERRSNPDNQMSEGQVEAEIQSLDDMMNDIAESFEDLNNGQSSELTNEAQNIPVPDTLPKLQ